jgi:hypothetical protein
VTVARLMYHALSADMPIGFWVQVLEEIDRAHRGSPVSSAFLHGIRGAIDSAPMTPYNSKRSGVRDVPQSSSSTDLDSTKTSEGVTPAPASSRFGTLVMDSDKER